MSNPMIRALVFIPLLCLGMIAFSCALPPVSRDPEPCVYMPVELHKPESVTQAGLEAMYGANLDGGTKQ